MERLHSTEKIKFNGEDYPLSEEADNAPEIGDTEDLTNDLMTEFRNIASASECTGLMQGAPVGPNEKENYGELFDYGAEAGVTGKDSRKRKTRTKSL